LSSMACYIPCRISFNEWRRQLMALVKSDRAAVEKPQPFGGLAGLVCQYKLPFRKGYSSLK
ncbi:hypothetical protein, partial [Brucella pseudogrignonensis]|uniref:hypothetical protein n=1 Tax=Brucella pseudogrignonensis TaxID=419475 RepID=UPI00286A8A85